MAIKCPKCQADNTDTARFCSNCAKQLTSAGQPIAALTKTLETPAYVLSKGSVVAGKYRILEEIGRGGMGVVYEAEDTKLARKVAIKVLPGIFTQDPERLARFEREARVLASLNHPNIAAIHGVEEAEGKRFLVLELVEGETLAERLSRGPLPVEEALEVCLQIAEGLEGAHEKNIIHRDLKPSNIKITPGGKVKILDFGLARATYDQISEVDLVQSPTITADMTRPGVILGTAAYMSPEQTKGKPVDKRADIWAYGCILYECLTGKQAFQGETVTEILAAIIRGEPDWKLFPENTPISIRTLLRRCLEKNPKERLRDIGDARLDIAEAMSQPSASEAVSIRRPVLAWILGGVICGMIIGAVATALITWHLRPAAPSPSTVRSVLKIEPGQWLEALRRDLDHPTRTAFAISSDGRFIVYSAIPEKPGLHAKPQIYLRRMDQMNAAPVAGTEGGISPFLSPDDHWIGFWGDGKLKKVPASGGVPTTLCDGAWPFGADWGPENTIVFSSGRDRGLSRISGEGGKPEVLTIPDKAREYSHRLPHWLSNGRGVLFTVMRHKWDLQPRLALLDLQTRKWHVVIEDAADGRCLRTGHLVFMRQGTLMAVRFDLDRLEVKGQPVPIVANTMQALNIPSSFNNTAAGQYSVSSSGWLAYVPGGIIPDSEDSLVRVDHKGNVQPVAEFKAPFVLPRFSPDGQRIAYQTVGKEWRLWVYDLNRGTASPLTGEGWAESLVWTPDGKHLVLGWCASGPNNLYWQPADGSSPMERLTTGENWQYPGSFTPDGSTLAFVEDNPETSEDILLLDMKTRRVTPFLNSKAREGWPEFSPDGHWMAYASDESGRYEVWVRPFPGPGGRWQISKEGGVQPVWSKDGKQLFYRQAEEVWVSDVRTEGGFSVGKPRLLFEKGGFFGGSPVRGWDLWPDGQQFLMVKLEERKPTPVTEMILVQNWFEELKRIVPTGKK